MMSYVFARWDVPYVLCGVRFVWPYSSMCVEGDFLGVKERDLCEWGMERPPSNGKLLVFLLLGLRPGHTALSKQCISISRLPHPPRGQWVRAGWGEGWNPNLEPRTFVPIKPSVCLTLTNSTFSVLFSSKKGPQFSHSGRVGNTTKPL